MINKKRKAKRFKPKEMDLPIVEKYKWYERPVHVTSKGIEAQIIEDYVANDKNITELSRDYGLRHDKVYDIIQKYYKKPLKELNLISKV